MKIRSHLLGGAALAIPFGFNTEGGEEGGAPVSNDGGEGEGASEEGPSEAELALEKEFDNAGTPGEESGSEDGSGSAEDDNPDDDAGEDDNADGADGDEPGEEGGEEGEGAGSEGEEGDSARIQELTARAEKAEADLAEARAVAEKAGISLDAATDEEVTIPEEPDASKYKFGENDLDYIRDHGKWEAKMEFIAEQARGRFKVEAATLEAKWTKNLVGAHQRYSDFDEVVVKGAADKKWPCPPVVALAIKDSDYGADVAYELASNPEEAMRISKLTPLEQAREFGRLEERHHQKAETEKAKAKAEADRKTPNRITKAPTPPRRQVRGTGASGIRNLAEAAASDDFAAFEKVADAKAKERA